ncbi:MAG: DJ-1/PfpI family protein [Asgard group archaeon]|nr:DJ-1/PfpI family protein [Asgard group archaeon]
MKNKIRKISLILILSSLIIILPINTNITETNGALPSDGMKILVLLSDGYMSYGYSFIEGGLEALGFTIETAGDALTVDDNFGDPTSVDVLFTNVNISEYVAILIPSGSVDGESDTHPLLLAQNQDAMDIIDAAYNNDLVLMAYTDGQLVFAEAGIISGKNITCWATFSADIIAAGANYIEEGFPTVDDPFITWNIYPLAYTDVLDLIELLDLWETDAPVLDDLTTENLVTSVPGSIKAIAEMSDAWWTDTVLLDLYQYNITSLQFELISSTIMPNNPDFTIFTKSLVSIDAGNYTLGITATDILGNEESYTDLYRFIIGPTDVGSFNHIVLTFSISIGTIFIISKVRKKKNRM